MPEVFGSGMRNGVRAVRRKEITTLKPSDRDDYGGDLDHGGCTGTDDAVGEGEGGDVGVEGEVGEEGGQAEQHAAEHQTTTLTKHRHENQAT